LVGRVRRSRGAADRHDRRDEQQLPHASSARFACGQQSAFK
jgi:hypothetical protein